LKLGEPTRVGEIAGPHHAHPLQLCPAVQPFKGAVPAGGSGLVRVDMEVGGEFHAELRRRGDS
jgi:hypothetical protein